MNHPNDEEPRLTDIVVTKTIYDGDVILGTKMVRNPAVLRTDFLLISFQKNIASNYFYRMSGGFGWNYAASYYIPKDEVIKAFIDNELGYALGMTGGYERRLSDHLALSGGVGPLEQRRGQHEPPLRLRARGRRQMGFLRRKKNSGDTIPNFSTSQPNEKAPKSIEKKLSMVSPELFPKDSQRSRTARVSRWGVCGKKSTGLIRVGR